MKRWLGVLAFLGSAVVGVIPAAAQAPVYQEYCIDLPNTGRSCGSQAAPTAATTAGTGTLVAGGTAQALFTAGEVLHGCAIINPTTATEQGIGAAEAFWVDFTGATAVAAAGGTAVPVEAGSSINCPPGGGIGLTTSVSWIATTTGHKIVPYKW